MTKHYLTEEELAHANYKYVKREFINGRWRYWYDDPKKGKTIPKDSQGQKLAKQQYQIQQQKKAKAAVQKVKKTVEDAADKFNKAQTTSKSKMQNVAQQQIVKQQQANIKKQAEQKTNQKAEADRKAQLKAEGEAKLKTKLKAEGEAALNKRLAGQSVNEIKEKNLSTVSKAKNYLSRLFGDAFNVDYAVEQNVTTKYGKNIYVVGHDSSKGTVVADSRKQAVEEYKKRKKKK